MERYITLLFSLRSVLFQLILAYVIVAMGIVPMFFYGDVLLPLLFLCTTSVDGHTLPLLSMFVSAKIHGEGGVGIDGL